MIAHQGGNIQNLQNLELAKSLYIGDVCMVVITQSFLSYWSAGTPINSGNPVTASDLDDDYVRYFIPSNSLNSDRFEVRTENISGGTQGVVYLRNGSDLLVSDIMGTHTHIMNPINSPGHPQGNMYVLQLCMHFE